MTTWNRIWRLALWSGIVASATASRRHGRFPTTWVVHLVGNSFLLWLPEIYTGLSSALKLDDRLDDRGGSLLTVHELIKELIVENSTYAVYVTPVALGVIAAHPGIDIYKSEWAQKQLFGMGLDSIPHATTALALTEMVFDGLDMPAARRGFPAARGRAAAISAAVLAGVTLFYETGEFLIHNSELKGARNDPSRLAMEWSLPDSIEDAFSNLVGWAAAVLAREKR